MVAPAGINNQELAVAAELARVHDPAVARRDHLAAVARLDDEALGLAAELRLLAECRVRAALAPATADSPWRRAERHGGLDAAGREHGHADPYAGASTMDGLAIFLGLAGQRRLVTGGSGRCCRRQRSDFLLVGAKTGTIRTLPCRAWTINSPRSDTLLVISAATLRSCPELGLPLGQRLALRFLKPGKACPRIVQPNRLGPQPLAVRADAGHHAHEVVQLLGERNGLAAQLGKRGGEQHGAAHHASRRPRAA